jgi:hypothetical protein
VSRYNESLHGWAGHTNTSGVQGSVAEVLARVRSHMPEEVIHGINILTTMGEKININHRDITNNLLSQNVNFPDNCYTLDLAGYPELIENIGQVIIIFKDMKNRSASVHVQGRSTICDRTIQAHMIDSSGDGIFNNEVGVQKSYVVRMQKKVFVEEDPAKSCRNYPNHDFASYRDCDNQWLKHVLASRAPGFVPVWIAGDIEEVTTNYVLSGSYGKVGGFELSSLYSGIQLSNCSLPCNTVQTASKFLEKHSLRNNKTLIKITFDQTVQVSTTDFVKPALCNFLSDVGGSVGLWLGLGVVQAAKILINFVPPRFMGGREE